MGNVTTTKYRKPTGGDWNCILGLTFGSKVKEREKTPDLLDKKHLNLKSLISEAWIEQEHTHRDVLCSLCVCVCMCVFESLILLYSEFRGFSKQQMPHSADNAVNRNCIDFVTKHPVC